MKRIILMALMLACLLTNALGETKTAVVCTNGARLPMLWMPIPYASVIQYIPNGEAVTIEKEMDGWYLITYERRSGYVKADYIAMASDEVVDAAIAEMPPPSVYTPMLTQNAARDIADAALMCIYPDFILSEYGIVQMSYREDTQDYGTYYGFEYFCSDGSRFYCCYVDAYSGSILRLLPPSE